MSASEIVNKAWSHAHAHVLRDDGVGHGDYVYYVDYVEQITHLTTYLIFLKMAAEREHARQVI